MKIIRKFISQTDWLWYDAQITDEQAREYQEFQSKLELDGNAEEPEWLYDLDFDLVRDKPGHYEEEFTLIDSNS